MRKILSAVVVAGFVAAVLGGVAEAKDMTNMKGVGWYNMQAPIGGILWFGPKMGVTAGVGFDKTSLPGNGPDPKTQFSVAGALPIVLAGSDDVNFMFRPGVLFESHPAGAKSAFEVDADLAVEVWLSSRCSVLAGHGVHFTSEKAEDVGTVSGGTTTFIGSHAISLTEVGFYFYFMK